MTRVRWAAVPAALSLLATAACGSVGQADSSVAGKDALVIGVQSDQPGLGERIGSTENGYDSYDGFDIDIAKEIARQLEVPAANVTFKPVTSKEREELIESGDVDFVVGSYSITPDARPG